MRQSVSCGAVRSIASANAPAPESFGWLATTRPNSAPAAKPTATTTAGCHCVPIASPTTARRFASLAAVLLSAGCASMVEVPVDTPLQSKLDVSGFRRILIAGFVTDLEDSDVDLSAETSRLLQNQLRSNTQLQVLEPDRQPPLAQDLPLPEGSDTPFEHEWVRVDEDVVLRVSVPILAGGERFGRIMIWALEGPLRQLDYMAVERTLTLAAFEIVKQRAVAEVERRYRNVLLDQILSGAEVPLLGQGDDVDAPADEKQRQEHGSGTALHGGSIRGSPHRGQARAGRPG